MASAKRKSREGLIAGGYCPICSKCTHQTGDGLDGGFMLYRCRKCGTLLLEVSALNTNRPQFVEVTEHWEDIWNWYTQRHQKMDSQVSELEKQLFAEVSEKIIAIRSEDAARSHKGLALVKPQSRKEATEVIMFDGQRYEPGDGTTPIYFRAPRALAKELDNVTGGDERKRTDFLVQALMQALSQAKL